jgi:hypothetical protein
MKNSKESKKAGAAPPPWHIKTAAPWKIETNAAQKAASEKEEERKKQRRSWRNSLVENECDRFRLWRAAASGGCITSQVNIILVVYSWLFPW